MDTKKKLIISGICILIIMAVLIFNVVRKFRSEDIGDKEDKSIQEDVVSHAEAYRCLSFLKYDRANREALPKGIVYADKGMSGWYDAYVNAVWTMGLIEGNISDDPKKPLSYGECKELIDKLIIHNPEYQAVYTGLSFDFVHMDEPMPILDFLELYEAALNLAFKKEAAIKKELLFVLGIETTVNGKERMVADGAKYYYENGKDYSSFMEKLELRQSPAGSNTEGAVNETNATVNAPTNAPTNTTTKNPANTPTSTPSKAPKNTPANSSTDAAAGSSASNTALTGETFRSVYADMGVRAWVRGQEIIYITGHTTEKILLHNVWIKQGKDTTLEVFVNGLDKSFTTRYRLSKDVEGIIGDIAVEDRKVVGISVKPDIISGKVLMTGEDFIELEGFGKLMLEEHYRIYKTYGEMSMEQTNSILVGYESSDFVVSNGKISAALIKESIKAENIRVLLHNTGYKDIYHDKIILTADSDFTIKTADEEKSYDKGKTVNIEPGDENSAKGRIKVTTTSENGRIELLSVERSTGNPEYRGSIEILETDRGFLIVNELPLEEYLYAVIPSEMPTYYGPEALKVQAVCARSYAYRHLYANSLSDYGAHVDDSVSYQVYNNIEENEDTILAVKDTYGKVVKYGEEVITAYYFSTSCGHTTGVEDVWVNGVPTPYLKGRLMSVDEAADAVSQAEGIKSYRDLSDEETFRRFIEDREFLTYDSGYNWYRWKVTISAKDLKSNIDSKLSARYKANPSLIQTLTGGKSSDPDAVFESMPIDTIGDILNISVRKRGTGGIIYELLIEGTERTIVVRTEYNIRVLLSPASSVIYPLDNDGVEGLSLLPSAFFTIDQVKEEGGLKEVTLTGGGYGHGVGMSQNGVKSMADAGKNYEEIIKYYYEGTELGFIYE